MTHFQAILHLGVKCLDLLNRDIIGTSKAIQRLPRFHMMQIIRLAADFGRLLRPFDRLLGVRATCEKHSEEEQNEEKQSIIHDLIHFQNYSHSIVAGGFDEMS